jgi:hypothetical protein
MMRLSKITQTSINGTQEVPPVFFSKSILFSSFEVLDKMAAIFFSDFNKYK